MIKTIRARFMVKKETNYHITFYDDGTYQFEGYPENMWSYWKIEDDMIWYQHEKEYKWRPLDEDGAMLTCLKAFDEELFENELLGVNENL